MPDSSTPTPILKWAGGKTQILDEITSRVPDNFSTYYEPFLGGGAVLFRLVPQHAIVNDINPQLINLYRQIRNLPWEIKAEIKDLDSRFQMAESPKEFYYRTRARYNEKLEIGELSPESAALLIWINKHCFNGLYRINKQGQFNVPFNGKTVGRSVDPANIQRISDYLFHSDVSLTSIDFEEACDDAQPGDFVYFDPPYYPASSTANFTNYAAGGFTESDHIALASLFRRLDRRGVMLMLSNSDTEFVRERYGEYRIESIQARRAINRDGANRTGREVIIRNY